MAVSLKLILVNNQHPFESDILCKQSVSDTMQRTTHTGIEDSEAATIGIKSSSFSIPFARVFYTIAAFVSFRFRYVTTHGLEPGWLGASFGLRICYVRIIIARN